MGLATADSTMTGRWSTSSPELAAPDSQNSLIPRVTLASGVSPSVETSTSGVDFLMIEVNRFLSMIADGMAT